MRAGSAGPMEWSFRPGGGDAVAGNQTRQAASESAAALNCDW